MRHLRILDFVIFALALGVFGATVLWASTGRGAQRRVEIEASGERYLLPLGTEETLTVQGPVGDTRIEVSDGAAHVAHSDCRDKICIAMGDISEPGAWVACLPNRVFVRIIAVDDDEGEVDAGAF